MLLPTFAGHIHHFSPHSRTYLSRLESGWEEAPCPLLLLLPPVPENPLPVPADWRFPDRSFSTAARFPVRAASRSSCSFPIADPKDFREDAGKRGKTGEPDCRMKFLCDPPFFNPPDRKLFLTIAARLERKQKLPPPMDPFILIHGAAGGKVWSAARYQHRANFLWPVPPSFVRHFLETVLFFCTYKSKTLRATPAPPPRLLYKKVDGYKQYGAPA